MLSYFLLCLQKRPSLASRGFQRTSQPRFALMDDSEKLLHDVAVSFLPLYSHGQVVHGFGRGGHQLGCPTANLSDDAIGRLPPGLPSGVYFGFANVNDGPVYGMVMSVGQNIHFMNKSKTMEVHILHEFEEDFYGAFLKLIAVDYLRPMNVYDSVEDLIKAIQNDIKTAQSRLGDYDHFRHSPFFSPGRQ